jgi:hypothetical protein
LDFDWVLWPVYPCTQKLLKNSFAGSTQLEVRGTALEWENHFKAFLHTQKLLKNYFEGPAQLEVRDCVRLSRFDLIIIDLQKITWIFYNYRR